MYDSHKKQTRYVYSKLVTVLCGENTIPIYSMTGKKPYHAHIKDLYTIYAQWSKIKSHILAARSENSLFGNCNQLKRIFLSTND